MGNRRRVWAAAATLLLAAQGAGAVVAPIQNAYGHVFPTLTEQSLSVFRSAADSAWYTSFNLLTRADVTLGALGYGGGFDLTAIRLVTLDGANVAFGTDTFSNPFANSIEALVPKTTLPAGQYALEVSGSGNRANVFGDLEDFAVRLRVTASPLATPVADVSLPTLQGNYGNVFPTLTEQSLAIFRTPGSSTWYTGFNLLADANVKLGALGFDGGFDLTSIRLVDGLGRHVAFGTDTVVVNPFPSEIEALVSADNLRAGVYALEVSGSGNRANIFGDLEDFAVRLQVTPVPEPITSALLLCGLAVVSAAARSHSAVRSRHSSGNSSTSSMRRK